jgi:hypothetical protein
MSDIESHPEEIPDPRRTEALAIARLQAEGKQCPFCGKRTGHVVYCSLFQVQPVMLLLALPVEGPSEESLTVVAMAQFSQRDAYEILKDKADVELTRSTAVSPEVQAECEAELEAGRKHGWK